MNQKASKRRPQPISIAPLTRPDSTGALYRRTSAVEEQIAEALSLEQSTLIERASRRNFQVSGYLSEECIVYLIRKFRREEHDDVVNKLTELLIQRCQIITHSLVSFALDPTYTDDCYQEVIKSAFEVILDTDSNKCDFAQVRFRLWLERVTFNVLRRYWKQQRQDLLTDSYDEDEDSNEKGFAETPEVLRDKTMPLDLQAMCREGLNVLNEKERMVFIMRYYWEWEIENQNPDEMTISKYLGVTSRAIRYQLRKAEAKLQEWRGGKR